MKLAKRKMLIVLIDLTDTHGEQPLYEAIVHTLERHGMAGATVTTGVMGYGRHRQIHRKGLFGMSDEKPVTITCIDDGQKIEAVLPVIAPMVKEGLVAVQDIEVLEQ
jgi:PII-like signaling protein